MMPRREPNIYRRGKYWYVGWKQRESDGSLRQILVGGREWRSQNGIPGDPFRTYGEARAARQEILDARLGKPLQQPAPVKTLREWLMRWLKYQDSRKGKKALRETTKAGYRTVLEKWVLRQPVAATPLPSLSTDDLEAMYQDLRDHGGRDGSPLSERSVQLVHTLIKAALRDAVTRTPPLLTRNPAETAQVLHADAQQESTGETREFEPWTERQMQQFLEVASGDRLGPLFTFAALTGARRGEVLGLRWEDLDLDKGSVKIRRTLVMVNGRVTEGIPKTKAGRREFRLGPRTIAALRAWKTRQLRERQHAEVVWMNSDYVFTREDGSPLHPDRVAERFRAIVRDAELPSIRFHDLRHIAASYLAKKHPYHEVARMLGHDPRVLLSTYAHEVEGATKELAMTMESVAYGGEVRT